MNWKIVLAVSASALLGGVLSVVGCGGDDCTVADDHMAECNAATTSGGATSTSAGGQEPVCSGARACYSLCINTHSCTQITGNDPGFTKCIYDCQGK